MDAQTAQCPSWCVEDGDFDEATVHRSAVKRVRGNDGLMVGVERAMFTATADDPEEHVVYLSVDRCSLGGLSPAAARRLAAALLAAAAQ